MAEADHSAVWAIVKALKKEIMVARLLEGEEKVAALQRRLMIWSLKAIAQRRVTDPAALAQAVVDDVEPRPL